MGAEKRGRPRQGETQVNMLTLGPEADESSRVSIPEDNGSGRPQDCGCTASHQVHRHFRINFLRVSARPVGRTVVQAKRVKARSNLDVGDLGLHHPVSKQREAI
jgi:hypothetical protein